MKRGKKQKKQRKQGARFVQRTLILLTAIALALCAASVTYGLFWRHDEGSTAAKPGESQIMFRIEVLNGVGTQGLANRAADGLRRMGIDVFKVGNAERVYSQSILLARNGNPQIPMLGKLLNCPNIIEQLQEEPLVDATLILGEDYRTLNLGISGDSGLH